MKKNARNIGVLFAMTTIFLSCDENDTLVNPFSKNVNDIEADFEVPSTYVFERNDLSTVSYGGQTTRLSMAKEILGYLSVDSGKSVQEIEAAFAHVAGADDFSTTELNESSKSVKSKVAASDDLFGSDAVAKEAIQLVMSGFLEKQVTEVVPNSEIEATPGAAGFAGSRYVSAKGLEYNQAFNKGLIGALIVDQALNNY